MGLWLFIIFPNRVDVNLWVLNFVCSLSNELWARKQVVKDCQTESVHCIGQYTYSVVNTVNTSYCTHWQCVYTCHTVHTDTMFIHCTHFHTSHYILYFIFYILNYLFQKVSLFSKSVTIWHTLKSEPRPCFCSLLQPEKYFCLLQRANWCEIKQKNRLAQW